MPELITLAPPDDLLYFIGVTLIKSNHVINLLRPFLHIRFFVFGMPFFNKAIKK